MTVLAVTAMCASSGKSQMRTPSSTVQSVPANGRTNSGLRTLGVRMRQHGESALRIARWLETRPEVARVLHPALATCPGHEFWARDFNGSTGLFSFVLNGGSDAARAALIDGLDHFGIGYSWGGYESLALPVDPEKYRSATIWHAEGPVVRLSIGLEDCDDLITDLDAALRRFAAQV